MFVKGQHTGLATRFRKAVISDIKARWPNAQLLPLLPSGGLPLEGDLLLTPAGYRIERAAAASYNLPLSSPLVAPTD